MNGLITYKCVVAHKMATLDNIVKFVMLINGVARIKIGIMVMALK